MLMVLKAGRSRRTIVLNPATQAALYNVRTAAGNPTDPVDVIVTVAAGVVLQAGLATGTGWATGTTVKLINNGTIAGVGGGDTAGVFGFGGFATTGSLTAGGNGRDGGDAIAVNIDLVIDNTNGFILGGGGQGGGGGASWPPNPAFAGGTPGGGGGGGRGYNNALGGDKGNDSGLGFLQVATDGANGSSSSAGAGGLGATCNPITFTGRGGDGGDGGDWGQDGQNGDAGSNGSTNTAGGTKGLAGRAVRKNGFTVTFLGGNNGTQVKGLVA